MINQTDNRIHPDKACSLPLFMAQFYQKKLKICKQNSMKLKSKKPQLTFYQSKTFALQIKERVTALKTSRGPMCVHKLMTGICLH